MPFQIKGKNVRFKLDKLSIIDNHASIEIPVVKDESRMKTQLAKKNALSDMIYEKLYTQIVNGKLDPGQRITELQIAQAEGVSQAPVREALKRLAEDRLVDLVPRSGCYVCKITRQDAEYLFEIRKRLESLALEYALDRFDTERVILLREKMLACSELDEKRLVRRALELDGQFHSMICESSGSVDLELLVSKLRARIQMLRIREAKDPTRAKISLLRHIEITDAILDGDRNAALELLAKHIEETRENVLENFINDEG